MKGMVSRRKFISMTMMMLVLLFMFQFTQVIKDVDNDYNVNDYAGKITLNDASAWQMNQNADESIIIEETQNYVAFLGNTNEQVGSIVEQWCIYTKRNLKAYSSVTDLKEIEEVTPEVLLIDSDYVDFSKETNMLIGLADKGISMIFCDLPDVQVIERNARLRELLGIRSVEASEVELSGIKLFSGFLLGGETIYTVEEGQDSTNQDLDLKVPWYVAFGGTKTYMVGMPEDETAENEYLPAIIWRNSHKNAQVFAVNGDYMYDSTGLGMLSAMMMELHPYELYPIINAQNLTIANFPGFADENAEEMVRIYSRSQGDLYRDIMWPSIAATTKKNRLRETVFFMAQADYADGNEPEERDYVFYLKELKEQKAEAGVSIDSHVEDIALTQKAKRDSAFYEKANDGYVFTAGYADSVQEAEALIDVIEQEPALQQVKTLVQKYNPEGPLVSYVSQDITLQNTTSNGFDFTFSQDLRMKSLETALGYSNILLDMYPVSWPESTEDVWEKMYDTFSRNVNTFWKPFKVFESTTISESDNRVRGLLGLDYKHDCKNNIIYLQIDNMPEQTWFILRTHGQEIEQLVGASYQEIEEDSYLLQIEEENVRIHLKDTNELYYYPQE